jgi:hypothetical protein
MDKVARELAQEAREDRRAHYRKFKLKPDARPADKPPERVAPVAWAGARRGGRAETGQPAGGGRPGARRGPRTISEELPQEARRLYGLGLSMRGVAGTLLEQTRCANANNAEVGAALPGHAPRLAAAHPRPGAARAPRPRVTTWPAPPERPEPKQPATERSRPQTTRGREQLVPTKATALSSARPLFLCPEAIRLYGYVAIQAGPEVTAPPLTVLEDSEDSALIEARARRRSARRRAAAAPPPEPARRPGLPLLPAGRRPGRRRPGGAHRLH